MISHEAEASERRDERGAVDRALMARDILELRDDVKALRAEVVDLVALFKGAKAVVNSVKWFGGIGGGLAALWALLSPFVHFNHK